MYFVEHKSLTSSLFMQFMKCYNLIEQRTLANADKMREN